MTSLKTLMAGALLRRVPVAGLLVYLNLLGGLRAAPWDPAAADYTGRKGTVLLRVETGRQYRRQHLAKAFRTIQAALDAVPDDQGGHQIIVRPDTYVEANLAPAHQGASGAYNALIGDFDGGLGSGARGWVVIDSGDQEKGFKSWDWWGTIRASDKHWPHGNNQETFSSIVWDRWVLRGTSTWLPEMLACSGT